MYSHVRWWWSSPISLTLYQWRFALIEVVQVMICFLRAQLCTGDDPLSPKMTQSLSLARFIYFGAFGNLEVHEYGVGYVSLVGRWWPALDWWLLGLTENNSISNWLLTTGLTISQYRDVATPSPLLSLSVIGGTLISHVIAGASKLYRSGFSLVRTWIPLWFEFSICEIRYQVDPTMNLGSRSSRFSMTRTCIMFLSSLSGLADAWSI